MKVSPIGFFRGLVLVLAVMFAFACKTPESKCTREQLCFVDSIQVVDTLKLGQTATLKFLVGIGNGCGRFDKLEINNDTTAKQYEVFSYAYFEGCVCTDIYSMIWQTTQFTPNKIGRYTLKFYEPDNTQKISYLQVVQ